jgi:AcrR family transcriptional regulator
MRPQARARLTRKESQELTRGRLLDSAQRCFARYGYDGSSVDRIAEGAGFSKGAFYSNFDSKESILLEILRGHHAEYIADLRAMIDQATNAEQMNRALGRWSAMRNQEPEWASLNIELQLQAKRDGRFRPKYLDYFRRYREALAELITLRFEKVGLRPPARVDDLAAVLVAIADGLALQRTLAGPATPEITGTMVRLVSDGWIALAAPTA